MQIEVRRWLTPSDMLAAAIDVGAEGIGEAKVGQMAAQPAGRARGGHGLGKAGRERAHEIDGAGHRANALAQRPDALFLTAVVEFGRERLADPLFDRGDELRAAQAHEMLDGFLGGGAMAEIGQQLGKQTVALELAFNEHAVEVEDDRVEVRHQSSNSAVPTRIAVAPSITAALKSADIPMLKPVTSWRRASLASNAK
jgi:hypothetical protein